MNSMSLSNHCQPFQTVYKQALEMNSYTVKYSILSKHIAESQKRIYIPKTKSKKQAKKKKLEKCALKKPYHFFI